jgi:membrane associated rhomboid family serine protease
MCGGKLLLFLLVFLLLSGGVLLYNHENRFGVELSNGHIKNMNGKYYYRKKCAVNAKTADLLPFGCFEKEDTYATTSGPKKKTGLPDLVGVEKLIRQQKRIKKLPMLRFFRISINSQMCIWYLDFYGEMISSSVGVPAKVVVPPKMGWTQAVSFTLESFGRSDDAAPFELGSGNVASDSSPGLLSIVFGGGGSDGGIGGENAGSAASQRSQMQLEQSPFFRDIKVMPQTCMLIFVMVIIFIHQKWYNKSLAEVSIGYTHIVEDHQFSRIFTSTFSHASFLHVLFNMASLYPVGTMEATLGAVLYLNYTFILVVVSSGFHTLMQHLLLRYRGGRYTSYVRNGKSVGYSGVLFGWIVVQSLSQAKYCPIPILPSLFKNFCLPTWNPFGLGFKFNLGPFISLLLIQVIVPRVSFLGHASGIVAGYFISWGAFRPLSLVGLGFGSGLAFGACSSYSGPPLRTEAGDEGSTKRLRLCSVLKLCIVAIGHFFVSSQYMLAEMVLTCALSSALFFLPTRVLASDSVLLRYLRTMFHADSLYVLYHASVLAKNWALIPESTGMNLGCLLALFGIAAGHIACNAWLLWQ